MKRSVGYNFKSVSKKTIFDVCFSPIDVAISFTIASTNWLFITYKKRSKGFNSLFDSLKKEKKERMSENESKEG